MPSKEAADKAIEKWRETHERLWKARQDLSDAINRELDARREMLCCIGTVTLTPCEKRVYSLLIEGLGDKEIASRLNFAYRTAKFHVSNILHKTSTKRRGELRAPVARH